jgi:hypothetical protein
LLTGIQLVAGLSYIHEELSIHHGELNCVSIMLNVAGMVKIGKSGLVSTQQWLMKSSQYWGVVDPEQMYHTRRQTCRRADMRGLGFIMIELMQPATHVIPFGGGIDFSRLGARTPNYLGSARGPQGALSKQQ